MMATDSEIAEGIAKLQEQKAQLRRSLEALGATLAEEGLILDVDAAFDAITSHHISLSQFITRPEPSSRH